MYDADYFIDKFEKIPDAQWTTGRYFHQQKAMNQYCAVGHCGGSDSSDTEESAALKALFSGNVGSPVSVNDGRITNNFSARERYILHVKCLTPKSRILQVLNWIKEDRPLNQEKYR